MPLGGERGKGSTKLELRLISKGLDANERHLDVNSAISEYPLFKGIQHGFALARALNPHILECANKQGVRTDSGENLWRWECQYGLREPLSRVFKTSHGIKRRQRIAKSMPQELG